MKAFIFAIMTLVALSVAANAAQPVKLSKEKMATITAGEKPPGKNPDGQTGGCPANPNCTPPTGNWYWAQ
jgi:hypothetical protein